MTEQPVITKAPPKQAIYDNHLVNVVGEANGQNRLKIQWDGGRNGLVERYVDAAELIFMDDALPQPLLDLAARLQGATFARPFAQVYLHQLRQIHERSGITGWYFVPSEVHAPREFHQVRRSCADLFRAGYLNAQPDAVGGQGWRLSQAGCELLDVAYLPAPQPETPPAPVADAIAQAEAAILEHELARTAAVSEQVEIKTLIQTLGHSKERGESDRELAAHLGDHWHILDIQIVIYADDLRRVITLQRWTYTPPPPQPEAKAAVSAPADPAPESAPVQSPLVEPVGPAVVITSTLPLGPYGRSILHSGLAETLDIADQAAAEAGRQAYARALEANPIIVRPLLASVNHD